jgi:hypothetical protein
MTNSPEDSVESTKYNIWFLSTKDMINYFIFIMNKRLLQKKRVDFAQMVRLPK